MFRKNRAMGNLGNLSSRNSGLLRKEAAVMQEKKNSVLSQNKLNLLEEENKCSHQKKKKRINLHEVINMLII